MGNQLVTLPPAAMSGIDKAAVLMLSLDPDRSRRLMESLEFDDIRTLSQAMSALGRADRPTVERVLGEFCERVGATSGVVGSYDATERLLASFLESERVEAIMEEIRGPAGRTIWEKLVNVNEAVLASYLKNEYPQTVAVVLSRIEAAHAARVLANLPDDFALEVVSRMLRMEVVQNEIIGDVERTLRAEFMSNLARTNRRDNHEVMAEIFNFLDRQTESRLITSLEERDKESADRIKALMFTFENLVRLDAAGVQTLIRSVGNERIGLALKGASEQLKDLILGNMSERAGKILKDDMAAMGPVRLKDVEEAQQFLVNTAKELAAAGEIYVTDDKNDQLVY
ncbi:flagellar motor switch protein FliG [Geminicoccus flavidas]|uniref:flagellar motor switch protein FliG n=1 Tax=Geminicoccus flavidas TaxID=2506407 RepID=UPI00190FB1F2|nr:flagellar motor switch protein FliG [Geminicoccus flavidas]